MSIICNKYGITQQVYDQMVRDGVISTTYPGHEEIYAYFKECLAKHNGKKLDAIQQVCDDKGVSQRTVYNILAELK